MTDQEWSASRLKRLQVSLIAAVGYPSIYGLGRTLRWRVEGHDHLDKLVASSQPPIMGCWHGRILPGAFFLRNRGLVVIVSQNFDGEWIARILRQFGFGTARGSSSRNASGALRQMVRHMRNGRGTAFTLDGPRGPARQAKSGAVWLARATGSPIVPFHAEASRAWTLNSWDRAQVPKPFATVAFVIGEPIFVPPDADEDAIETYRVLLETRLERLCQRALELARRGSS